MIRCAWVWTLALVAAVIPAGGVLGQSGSPAGTPEPAPRLTWSPDRPVQGHLFTVRLTLPPGTEAVRVEGEAAGEELHFTATGDGAWLSLAAAPVTAEEAVEVEVAVGLPDGRTVERSASVPVAPGDYRHERLTVAPELGRPLDPARQARLDRDREKAAEVSRRAHRTPRLWTDEVVPPRRSRVTSGFGNGRIFNGQVSSRHTGLDLAGAPGDTVVAPTRAVVELVDDFLLAGKIVYLNHGGGLVSGYFHLSGALVEAGDTVRAGTPIGLVGATGRVTGPHLHWVVRYGRTSVDPRSLPGLAPVE